MSSLNYERPSLKKQGWQLPPWFENLGKRQVKSPKVYLRDSGLLHSLLVVYPGRERFALREDVEVVPLAEMPAALRAIRPERGS